jgi:monoamine oxidase
VIPRLLDLWRWSERGKGIRAEVSAPTIALREGLDIIAEEIARAGELVRELEEKRRARR